MAKIMTRKTMHHAVSGITMHHAVSGITMHHALFGQAGPLPSDKLPLKGDVLKNV